MPRPPNAHVHAYETRSGTRWKVRWKVMGDNNEEGGFTDEAQANKRRVEILSQLLNGEAPSSAAGTDRLCDFAEFHFRTALTTKGTPLRPNTLKGYRDLMGDWVTTTITYPDPADPDGRRTKRINLGRMRLKDITPSVIEEWHYAAATHNPDRAAKAYRCVSAVLSRARRLSEIHHHPCQKKGAGSEQRAERKLPGADVPLRLSEALASYTDKYGHRPRKRFAAIPVLIGYGSALRKSEMRGLHRADVFPDDQMIRVVRQTYYDAGTRRWYDAEPKTASGKRRIWIGKVAMDALVAHMEEFMRPASEDPEGEDRVFTGPRGGPISDTAWSAAWSEAKRAAKVSSALHLHDLRHQAATTLARHGRREVKVIQEHLGDSTPRAAMMYLHATDESMREVGDVFTEAFAAFGSDHADADVVPIRRRKAHA
jgi:integrase